MTVGFHRGLTSELRRKMQMAGVRIEEREAILLLMGHPLFNDSTHPYNSSVKTMRAEVFDAKFALMKKWEEENPGVAPFPPIFAEEVFRVATQEGIESAEIVSNIRDMALEELKL